uniref:Uncharacterized protein n=1 Tax=Cucumis sativus TaxID=3659 RepID=A0A0A0L1K1_CUCSA
MILLGLELQRRGGDLDSSVELIPFSRSFALLMRSISVPPSSSSFSERIAELELVSKSFMNPSTSSSTHFRFWCLDKTCLVDAIWRSSSMEAYKSSSPNKPLQIDLEVEGDEFSNGFNLLSCSSILRVVGWDLEG